MYNFLSVVNAFLSVCPNPSIDVTCTACGNTHPHHDHSGPANFCPHCGRPSTSYLNQQHLNRHLARRKAVRTIRPRIINIIPNFR